MSTTFTKEVIFMSLSWGIALSLSHLYITSGIGIMAMYVGLMATSFYRSIKTAKLEKSKRFSYYFSIYTIASMMLYLTIAAIDRNSTPIQPTEHVTNFSLILIIGAAISFLLTQISKLFKQPPNT